MGAVGKNIPHDSAETHVSGQSNFIADIPPMHGELFVSYAGSPVAHGRIKAIHLDDARKLPGVEALFTAKDIVGSNVFGPVMHDECLLADDVAHFLDHPVVVIAATTEEVALAARRVIRIEVEELPPVFAISEAREKKQFIGGTRTVKTGDFASAYAAAPHRLEGIFETGGQEHFYLENQSALVVPGEAGFVTVHSSTQHPTEVQEVVAHVLGLPIHKVVCVTKRMGGGFGGKEAQATHIACMAALVSQKTGRPARMVLTKDDDMQMTGKRHPFLTDYKVGFDDEGRILAWSVDMFSDGGCAADLSLAIMGRAIVHADNAYFIENAEIRGTVCRTNRASNTAFRGFGGPQGVAAVENAIEEIARYLKRDALEVRKVNLYGKTDRNVTPYGEVILNNLLPELMEKIETTSDYAQRKIAIEQLNRESPTFLRGISMAPVKFGISFNTKFLNQASALVNVYLDGSIQVSTGGTEMGQGLNTKIRQLVAEEFTLDVERVILMPTSTEKSNNASATAASSGTDLNGSAAVIACRRIKERLNEFAAKLLARPDEGIDASSARIVWGDGAVWDIRRPATRIPFPELVHLAHRDRVSLGERGFYATQGVDFNWDTGKGHPFLYFTTGWAVSEVIIDRFTGELRVPRVDILMDIGRSINPGIDRGQITGAFIQGMGWVTAEELVYAKNGTLLSHSPTTYKIPNIQDTPDIFNVDWVENDLNTANVQSSKAVGEPPFLHGISVWTAIKHALSFAQPANGIMRGLRIPATSEHILDIIRHCDSKVGLKTADVTR